VECRAKRRVLELEEKGMEAKYEDVLREMIERDNNDKNRDVAPAVAAEDAVILDNSDLTMEQTLEKIVEIAKSRIDI
jgi:cytidylate kinase